MRPTASTYDWAALGLVLLLIVPLVVASAVGVLWERRR